MNKQEKDLVAELKMDIARWTADLKFQKALLYKNPNCRMTQQEVENLESVIRRASKYIKAVS
jgi:hypothetical protein